MAALFQIALRSLRRHLRRYVFVLVVLALGFAFISVMSALAAGMARSAENAALRHYAGHLFVIGRDKQAGSIMVVDHPRQVTDAIARAGVPVQRLVTRTHAFDRSSLFFHGASVRLKDLFGVDFAEEEFLFSGFDYSEGSFDPGWDGDTVVISEPVARRLRARVGDQIVLRVQTRGGQLDTRTLVVRAITADSSIFGFARAYMHRETLTGLMELGPAEWSVAGIFLPSVHDAPAWARRLEAELAGELSTAGPIETKDALTSAIRERWQGVRYFTVSLPVYVSEVTDLLAAMELASWLLLVMIMLVVLAATVVTYRVVLHDRAREIGTMLAVGFPRPWVVASLAAEAAILVGIAVTAGLLIAAGISQGASLLSFDWIPGFEIFLDEGRLRAWYRPATVLRNAAVVLGVVGTVLCVMVVSTVHRTIPALIKGETT